MLVYSLLVLLATTTICSSQGSDDVPLNFIGESLSSTAIRLTWLKPNGTYEGSLHYVVKCNETETERKWIFHAVEEHVNIHSLHPYYTYECQVAAATLTSFIITKLNFTEPINTTTDQSGIVELMVMFIHCILQYQLDLLRI